MVCIDANGIDSLTAMSIESLLNYPCGDSLMLLAKISSLSSDFGNRPVHNCNSELLGKGALIGPLPAFLPSRINHVFRKRALLRFSDFCFIDCSIPLVCSLGFVPDSLESVTSSFVSEV